MNSRVFSLPTRLSGTTLLFGRVLFGMLLLLSIGMFGVSLYHKFLQGTSGCASIYNAEWAATRNWCAEWFQAIEMLGITAVTVESYFVILRIVAAVPFVVLSLLLVWQRSHEVRLLLFGGLLLVMGFAGTWFNPFWQWGGGWFESYTAYPAIKVLSQLLTFLLWSGTLLFALLFPDGNFVLAKVRWLTGVIVLLLAGYVFGSETAFSWANWSFPLPILTPLSIFLFVIVAVLIRYRQQATETQRQQIKWVTVGTLLMIINMLLDFAVFDIYPALTGNYPLANGRQALWWELGQDTFSLVSQFALAFCFALSLLRYRLWDIDLIVSRTLFYVALTVLVVLLYGVLVAGLSRLLHNEDNLLASLTATGVIAVLFHPVSTRIQTLINRWLFGERDNPAGVFSRLTGHLEASDSKGSLLGNLVETIAVSLKLPYVALRLCEADGSLGSATESGRKTAEVEVIPLLHQQRPIGQLEVAPRSPGEALSSADQQLLAAIARLAATSVRTIQLSNEVQEARTRIVSAREEERRRLRRDLHDGLGPALSAIAAQSEAARDLIPTRPEVSTQLLNDIVSQSQSATADIRRLVYDLRPPALDDLGLVAAIHAQAQRLNQPNGLQVTVQAESLPALSAAVEVAAYRIVHEALNNVARHAQANRCAVSLAMVEDRLQVEVVDNGIGFSPKVESGVGLRSMRERAEELGGTFTISSPSGSGTMLQSMLPLNRAHSVANDKEAIDVQ